MEKWSASLAGQISLADQLWSRPRARAGGIILVAERFAGRGFVSWCFIFSSTIKLLSLKAVLEISAPCVLVTTVMTLRSRLQNQGFTN